MKWKEWNFLSAVLKLVVETLNMISCTHQCLAETLLCCWERLDELSLIFIWTEVERLDCSSAVALTNLKFHFCRVTLQLSCLSSVAPPLTAALTVCFLPLINRIIMEYLKYLTGGRSKTCEKMLLSLIMWVESLRFSQGDQKTNKPWF